MKLGHKIFFKELVDDAEGTQNGTKNPLTRIHVGSRCQNQEHYRRRWITKTYYAKIQHDEEELQSTSNQEKGCAK